MNQSDEIEILKEFYGAIKTKVRELGKTNMIHKDDLLYAIQVTENKLDKIKK